MNTHLFYAIEQLRVEGLAQEPISILPGLGTHDLPIIIHLNH